MNDGIPHLHCSEAVLEVDLGVVADGHDLLNEPVLVLEPVYEVDVLDVVLDVELMVPLVEVIERRVTKRLVIDLLLAEVFLGDVVEGV